MEWRGEERTGEAGVVVVEGVEFGKGGGLCVPLSEG